MLGKWLGEATAERHLPLSPASSFYMRSCRRRLLGAIHQHFNDSGFADSHIRVFTIINSRWFIPAGSLSACSAASIKAKFRRYLERALVIDAEGLLFAGLHGSFDGAGYQLHYHGIVAGDKVKALENLRGNFGFVSSKDIYRSLQFEKLNDPPRQISYTLQSWWPFDPQPSEAFAHGKRRRLPPDSHAEFLLWMANQNLMDLIVMSGMRIGKDGLESTRHTK